MALTRNFREHVAALVKSDPEFKAGLLSEGINALFEDEADVGRLLLRDFVNATIGFEALSQKTGIPAKSLMRMLSAKGNPSANNLFAIIHALRKEAGVSISAAIEVMDRAA